VHDWEERFAPIFADQLRVKRQGKVGKVWFVDETYIRVKGKWCYLDRGIDEDGNLVDLRLSEKRDRSAAKAFFPQAHEIGCSSGGWPNLIPQPTFQTASKFDFIQSGGVAQ
jgi:transposase-like protein